MRHNVGVLVSFDFFFSPLDFISCIMILKCKTNPHQQRNEKMFHFQYFEEQIFYYIFCSIKFKTTKFL